jgi:hypothetical protein
VILIDITDADIERLEAERFELMLDEERDYESEEKERYSIPYHKMPQSIDAVIEIGRLVSRASRRNQ